MVTASEIKASKRNLCSMLKYVADGSRDPENLTAEGAYKAEHVDSMIQKLAKAIVDNNVESWRKIKALNKMVKELSSRVQDLNIAMVLPVSPTFPFSFISSF